MIFSDLIMRLSTPDKSGRVGVFTIACAILGGLLTAYTAMTLAVFVIPAAVGHAMIVPFLFTPLAWVCAALWIFVAPSRLSALRRSVLPAFVCAIGIYILY